MFTGICRAVAAVGMVCFPILATAQVIPPSAQPGRERERFIEPQRPQARPGGPAITLPSTVAPPGAAKIKLILRDVRIVGSTVYRAEELKTLFADLVGHEVSLQAIYDLAQRITAKYGADGYVLSRAIVPPQQLDPKGSVARIEIIEGWVSKVEWPKSLSRYRDFFTDYAAKITAERPANIHTIERYLLLAGDLPGLKFATSLKPSSTSTGASTLVVEVTEKPMELNARIDNRGTPSRGPFQFLTSSTFNNMLGGHESFTVSYAGVSPLKELQYLSGNYRQVLSSEGSFVFLNGSHSWGKPGTFALETLQFRTLGTVVEAGAGHPVIRERERNLTLSALFFANNSHSDVLNTSFNEDRLRGVRLKADADTADSLQGINQFNLILSQGIQGLGSTQNGNPLASRASGRVDFTKFEATVSRTQPLFPRFSTYLAAYGQYAAASLLAPEQCGFGGRFFGRAFDPSQVLGDHCIEVIGELRYDLPVTFEKLSQAQLYSFTDYGQLYTREPAVGTAAFVHAASAGGGMRLGWLNYFNTDLQVAKAIDGPRNDWRFFFVLAARN